MRVLVLLAVFLFVSVVYGRANLGETVAQIVARYGGPTGYAEANSTSPFGKILFKSNGFELVVFILNNKEVGARISKTDKSSFMNAEIQFFIANDSSGSKWTPVLSSDPSCLQWSRGDKATALYDKDKHLLILTSDAMVNAIHARIGTSTFTTKLKLP